MHSIATAMAWLDTHSIGWSLALLFVAMLALAGLASLIESAVYRLAHREEIREEREQAARVERLRRAQFNFSAATPSRSSARYRPSPSSAA